MSHFSENDQGEVIYCLSSLLDEHDLQGYPKSLVKAVVARLETFIPTMMDGTSYDAQSILGELWDQSNHVVLGQIISAIANLPTTPIDADRASPVNRKRYLFT